jgi:hypothetical protein
MTDQYRPAAVKCFVFKSEFKSAVNAHAWPSVCGESMRGTDLDNSAAAMHVHA